MRNKFIRKPNTICSQCSKPIYRRPCNKKTKRSKGNFCSQECYGISCRKSYRCCICGTTYLGNKNTCSRSCANIKRGKEGYKGRPKKDKCKDLRAIKEKLINLRGSSCQLCTYNVTKVLVIHHIIPKKLNGSDNPNNLLLICPNCHGEIHSNIRTMEGVRLVEETALKAAGCKNLWGSSP